MRGRQVEKEESERHLKRIAASREAELKATAGRNQMINQTMAMWQKAGQKAASNAATEELQEQLKELGERLMCAAPPPPPHSQRHGRPRATCTRLLHDGARPRAHARSCRPICAGPVRRHPPRLYISGCPSPTRRQANADIEQLSLDAAKEPVVKCVGSAAMHMHMPHIHMSTSQWSRASSARPRPPSSGRALIDWPSSLSWTPAPLRLASIADCPALPAPRPLYFNLAGASRRSRR